ncbi:hypothetical protein [Streptomyces sp. NPDC004721]
MEAEVDAFLGRRYQQDAATVDAAGQVAARAGHRNGHCPTTMAGLGDLPR